MADPAPIKGHLKDLMNDGICYEADRIPLSMLKGARLLQETGPYLVKGTYPLASDKAEIIKELNKRNLTICDEAKPTFAQQGYFLQAIIKNACEAKVRVHVRVEVQELAAFLIPEDSHKWTAGDFEKTWDMTLSDTFDIGMGGLIPPTFGSLGNFRLTHDHGNINYYGEWTGPRSGVTFNGGGDKTCVSFINATPDAPVSVFFFFSSPYSDCTFDEDCGGVSPPHPLSDNFNNLPWKSFWDFKTYSPATSFPIGNWIVIVRVESLGPESDT